MTYDRTLIISEFWTVGLTNIYKLPLTFRGNLNGIFFPGHFVDQASNLLIKTVIVESIMRDHLLHVHWHCSTSASASLIPSGSVKVIIFHCRNYMMNLHLHLGISTCVRTVVIYCTHLVKGIILHLSARLGLCYCWVWYYPLWHWKIDEPRREAALQRRDDEKYCMYLHNCINIILSLAAHKVWTEISQYSDQQLSILSHFTQTAWVTEGKCMLISDATIFLFVGLYKNRQLPASDYFHLN